MYNFKIYCVFCYIFICIVEYCMHRVIYNLFSSATWSSFFHSHISWRWTRTTQPAAHSRTLPFQRMKRSTTTTTSRHERIRTSCSRWPWHISTWCVDTAVSCRRTTTTTAVIVVVVCVIIFASSTFVWIVVVGAFINKRAEGWGRAVLWMSLWG